MIVCMACRSDEGQRHEEEGEQAAGKPQGEADAAVDDDTENQLPVNTLFYGVRGQQVCQTSKSGTISCHTLILGLWYSCFSSANAACLDDRH